MAAWGAPALAWAHNGGMDNPLKAPVFAPGMAALGAPFAVPVAPQAVRAPRWLAQNHALAQHAGAPMPWLHSPEALALLAGNAPATPAYATVYSGHQFGVWAGQLGDGRALLLGSTQGADGQVWEWQLKGAGLTPFSRMGDGRAVWRSSIREFLASEAMHGLGIATTRALALVGSDTPVRRERTEAAAVLTRLAPSFVRFGHFEHLQRNPLGMQKLLDWVLQQHFAPLAAVADPAERALAWFSAVLEATADLMAQWQAVGFCHGVMNTDNMSVLGLTLDYGPFQFMDAFDPAHNANHSDTGGRYVYQNQPQVAWWNLQCLAQALVALVPDTEALTNALRRYPDAYAHAQAVAWARKLGLAHAAADALPVAQAWLTLLAKHRGDFTLSWRALSDALARCPDWTCAAAQVSQALPSSLPTEEVGPWLCQLQQVAQRHGHAPRELGQRMQRVNPVFVLRNHMAQEAIEAAEAGDPSVLHALWQVLQTPTQPHPTYTAWAGPPPQWAAELVLSCSS